jgi:hypothetical protein
MAETLRALSVQQPWSWAILHGKDIENRSWSTDRRGLIAIHASTKWDEDGRYDRNVRAAWFARNTGEALHRDADGIVRFAIVGVAELAGICTRRYGCDCGPWAAPGQYHWRLARVRALLSPVSCKGALGLWRLPDDVDAKVRAQLDYTTTGATR